MKKFMKTFHLALGNGTAPLLAATLLSGVIVWVYALYNLADAFTSYKSYQQAQQMSSMKLPTLTSKSLSDADYKTLATKYASKRVNIVGGNGLRLETQRIEDFDAWQGKVNEIMAADTSVRWSTVNFCVGEKCTPSGYSILMTGERTSF